MAHGDISHLVTHLHLIQYADIFFHPKNTQIELLERLERVLSVYYEEVILFNQIEMRNLK